MSIARLFFSPFFVYKMLGTASRFSSNRFSAANSDSAQTFYAGHLVFHFLTASESRLSTGGSASRTMLSSIAVNKWRVRAASASWNVKYFACRWRGGHGMLVPWLRFC